MVDEGQQGGTGWIRYQRFYPRVVQPGQGASYVVHSGTGTAAPTGVYEQRGELWVPKATPRQVGPGAGFKAQ